MCFVFLLTCFCCFSEDGRVEFFDYAIFQMEDSSRMPMNYPGVIFKLFPDGKFLYFNNKDTYSGTAKQKKVERILKKIEKLIEKNNVYDIGSDSERGLFIYILDDHGDIYNYLHGAVVIIRIKYEKKDIILYSHAIPKEKGMGNLIKSIERLKGFDLQLEKDISRNEEDDIYPEVLWIYNKNKNP